MTPIQSLERLLKISPDIARILLAGLALLAAAAIVASWRIDLKTGVQVGATLFLCGLIMHLFSRLSLDNFLGLLSGYAIFTLFFIYLSAIVYSAIFPHQRLVAPVYCLTWPFVPCNDLRIEKSNELAVNATAMEVPRPVYPPATSAIRALPVPAVTLPSKAGASAYRVDIQYYGQLSTDNIRELSGFLAERGWKVAAAQGERIALSANLNEVRYGAAADKDMAMALAAAVNEKAITSSPLVVKSIAIIPSNHLEIWISK